MQNQSAVTIAAQRSADHLRQYRKCFASSRNMTPDERALHELKIEHCADKMAASKTGADYEAALADAHRLGMFPYNADVALVARADVLYAD
jgi:hypothetical protein